MTNTKKQKIAKILSLIAFILIVLGYQGLKHLYETDYYFYTKDERLYTEMRDLIRSDAYSLMELVAEDENVSLHSSYELMYPAETTNLRYQLVNPDGSIIATNLSATQNKNDANWDYQIYFSVQNYGYGNHIETYVDTVYNTNNKYMFLAYIDEELLVNDTYAKAYRQISNEYLMKEWMYILLLAAQIIGILSMAFLTGLFHKKIRTEEEELKEQPKLYLLALLTIALYVLIEKRDYPWIAFDRKIFTFLLHPLLAILFVLTISFVCLQVDTAKFKTICKKYLCIVINKIKEIFTALSLVKRASIIVLGITLIEYLLIRAAWNNMGIYLLIWLVEKIILLPIIFIILLDLRKIKMAGEAFASGNLEYKLQTENMSWDFKKHGENMNCIADGLNIAIEKRLQSERMKTELITNVSHDIKTPITSIINYAGLIEKEPCDSPKHKEYAEVLVRKATHLKRLLDDLVEASKASTGTIEMKLEDCEANVLLTQVVGEFEQRLEEAKLQLVTKAPDESIMIHVDSKRIWRVFENLMMNACKYSLEGSRVYLNLDKVGNEAIFSFRNTSRTMLNISAEELKERFVRGDSSRSTEGNGLGLSIAKSLTELQNGQMDVLIDGDLFKVILRFPVIS